MTTQIKRRRGTTAEHASFTGAEGELTIDTTKDTVVVHDGTTAGGHPLAKESAIAGKVDTAGDTMTGDLSFGDNDKAIFGAGSDLQIYHDGATGNSFITEGGSGNLVIAADDFRIQPVAQDRNWIAGDTNGAVELYHDGGKKLATTSTGIDVTGTVTADGLTVEAGIAQLELIDTNVSGSTKLRTANAQTWLEIDPDNLQGSSGFATYIDGKQLFKIADTGDISFYEDTGTTPKFFWDASAESLGIGTNSPDSALHIASETNGTNTFTMESLDAFLSSTQEANAIHFQTNDGSATGVTGKISQISENGNEDLALAFSTYNGTLSEAMRIDSAGNVGIGEVSPSSYGKLTVLDGATRFWIKQDTSNEMMLSVGASERMLFGINNAEAMRIDSSGNLLVGTTDTTPYNNSSGTSADQGFVVNDGRIFAATNANSVSILNRTNSDGTIQEFRKDGSTVGSIGTAFGELYITDGSSGLRVQSGEIKPCNSAGSGSDNTINLGSASHRFKDLYLSGGLRGDTLTFSNLAGSERMRIDSSGNLLVGKTSANNTVVGIEAKANGNFSAVADGIAPALFRRKTSDGIIAEFAKDNSTVGSIATWSGDPAIMAANSWGVKLYDQSGNDIVHPINTSGNTYDGNVTLGYSASRFKDLYLSGGVYLGGTGSANKLDDYETGTFIPTLVASGTNPTVAYTARNGNYVKVGDSVTVHVYMLLSSFSGGSGSIQIASLPFTASNTRCSGSVSYSSGFPSAPQTCLNVSNSTAITLYYFSGSSVVGIPTTDLNGNEQIRLSLTYEV